VTSDISSTARSKAASFRFAGFRYPLTLRTNCSAAARISSSVAGSSKSRKTLMLRHITSPFLRLTMSLRKSNDCGAARVVGQ